MTYFEVATIKTTSEIGSETYNGSVGTILDSQGNQFVQASSAFDSSAGAAVSDGHGDQSTFQGVSARSWPLILSMRPKAIVSDPAQTR